MTVFCPHGPLTAFAQNTNEETACIVEVWVQAKTVFELFCFLAAGLRRPHCASVSGETERCEHLRCSGSDIVTDLDSICLKVTAQIKTIFGFFGCGKDWAWSQIGLKEWYGNIITRAASSVMKIRRQGLRASGHFAKK